MFVVDKIEKLDRRLSRTFSPMVCSMSVNNVYNNCIFLLSRLSLSLSAEPPATLTAMTTLTDQEHGVGGHQAGGVVGAGALAVQQSQARDQHVGADNPQGVQTVSCINNFLCFALKSFHEIIPESMLAKKMTPQAVLRRIMQRVMMLDTMKKL